MCEDDICAEHDINTMDAIYVAPGVVYLGCTKCPYWEPAPESTTPIEVIITHADGTTSTFIH